MFLLSLLTPSPRTRWFRERKYASNTFAEAGEAE